MRGLTIAVIVMGVLILGGFAVLVATILGRLAHGPHPVQAGAFTTTPIPIPRGARVAAMTAGTKRLILRIMLPDGGEEILIIDLATGRRIGTIDLAPTP